MGRSKISIAHIFSSHRNDVPPGAGQKREPLAISSPIGPVKNSRGPDFVRSEDLIIVDGIKDCVSIRDENETICSVSRAEKKTSVGLFSKRALLKRQSLATLASAKSVSSNTESAPRSKLDDGELVSSISKIKSASASTTTLFSINGEYTHVCKPQELTSPQKVKHSFVTKLPKSKTVNVLQDIKNSMHRLPTNSTLPSKPPVKRSDHVSKPAEVSKLDLFRSLRRRSREDSTSSSRHSSTTNITTPDSANQILKFELVPGQVAEAQLSAYWTGRFTALRDRLSSEHMACVLSQTKDTIQLGLSKSVSPMGMRHDDELSGTPPYPLRDEDALCQQVFLQLQSQCITKAAQESLRCWQENYARCRRRPALLPPGSRFLGASNVSRRFALHSRFHDRQGLAFLEDAYFSNASNAFGVTNPHSLEARYLNFR